MHRTVDGTIAAPECSAREKFEARARPSVDAGDRPVPPARRR